MVTYWPCASVRETKGPRQISTYNSALSIEDCMRQFKIWENWYDYEILSKWIDVYEGLVFVKRIEVSAAKWKVGDRVEIDRFEGKRDRDTTPKWADLHCGEIVKLNRLSASVKIDGLDGRTIYVDYCDLKKEIKDYDRI